MPHQCTNCGNTFPDGSKEMLSGCPGCGGNKFQFHPGEVPEEPPSDATAPDGDADSGVADAVGRAASTVRDLVGDSVPDVGAPADAGPGVDDSSPAESRDEYIDADAERLAAEDRAQADARSAVVDTDTLPDPPEDERARRPTDAATAEERSTPPTSEERSTSPTSEDQEDAAETSPDQPPSEGTVVSRPDEGVPTPGLDELREELNDQFESIRVLEPGQYELNLMELYDREEYIIALQENGRYVIEVPDAWRSESP